jgi:hypothetical protein
MDVLISVGIIVLCCAAIFKETYKENWLQHIGLFSIAIGEIGHISSIFKESICDEAIFVINFGLVLFAIGTASKVIKHS